MEKVVVSVVMPAYNCEKYIAQAIASVLKQNVSWELLIIDDASTDGTRKQIEPYLSDERIIYTVNEKNCGVVVSRNRGVSMARGKYIAFLDADDYWTDDKLERQLVLMEEKQAVLSSTARELMNERGELSGKIISVPTKITYRQLLKGNCINTSGVMVLTSVAKQYPMEQEHLHEDYIMWLRILQEHKVAYGLDAPLLKYRRMETSKSGNKLHSAKMTFGVYRYMGLNIIESVYYFCWYAIKGVIKYH